jgi:N6-adenosine-specific RNA methylase IME4
VLLTKRGNGLKVVDNSVRQVIFAPIGKRHSEKPQQIHEGLERLYGPDVRRLALFGRYARPDWTVWGNQVG